MESREREREREELRADSRKLKAEREEVDSQLKVFFKELREIKAVIKDSALRIKDSANKKQRIQKKSASFAVAKKGRKLKFRPEITRVKLNPEQAILSCNCYNTGWNNMQPGGTLMARLDGEGSEFDFCYTNQARPNQRYKLSNTYYESQEIGGGYRPGVQLASS